MRASPSGLLEGDLGGCKHGLKDGAAAWHVEITRHNAQCLPLCRKGVYRCGKVPIADRIVGCHLFQHLFLHYALRFNASVVAFSL